MTADSESADTDRAEARRRQVLEAASTCFRQHGFHATSIARISQAAGMSPGHIYHYFQNKEAIVAGIVEQNLSEFVELAQQLDKANETGSFVDALMAQIDAGVGKQTDGARASLNLEILAEAARNPEVASALQRSDDVQFARCRHLFRQAPSMERLPPDELNARITVINSLFDGLMVRTQCQSTIDKARTSRIIQRVVGFLLDEENLD